MSPKARKQLKTECAMLTQRLEPIMVEHFDTWMVIGLRVDDNGDGPCVHIKGGHFNKRIDHELIVAASLAIKRSGYGKKKKQS